MPRQVLVPFSLEEFDPELLLRDGTALALIFKDNPKYPRSFERKVEDSIIGLAPELHYLNYGFLKAPNKYQDVIGVERSEHFSNGFIEIKTIREPTLHHAQNALANAGNKEFDFAHIWHCDRSVGLYRPFAIFARANLQHPIMTF